MHAVVIVQVTVVHCFPTLDTGLEGTELFLGIMKEVYPVLVFDWCIHSYIFFCDCALYDREKGDSGAKKKKKKQKKKKDKSGVKDLAQDPLAKVSECLQNVKTNSVFSSFLI